MWGHSDTCEACRDLHKGMLGSFRSHTCENAPQPRCGSTGSWQAPEARISVAPAIAAQQVFAAEDAIRELKAMAMQWVWPGPFTGDHDGLVRYSTLADCSDEMLAIISKIGKPK